MRFVPPDEPVDLPFVDHGTVHVLTVAPADRGGYPALEVLRDNSQDPFGLGWIPDFGGLPHVDIDAGDPLLIEAMAMVGALPPVPAQRSGRELLRAWGFHVALLAARCELLRGAAEHARLAADLADAPERADWILINGSSRLRTAYLAGHEVDHLYRVERLSEYLPGCFVDVDAGDVVAADVDATAGAEVVADVMAQHARSYDGQPPVVEVQEILLLPAVVRDRLLLHGLDVDLLVSVEGVVLRGWLGAHDLWVIVASDAIPAGMPHVADPAAHTWTEMVPAISDIDLPGDRVHVGAAYGLDMECGEDLRYAVAQLTAALDASVLDDREVAEILLVLPGAAIEPSTLQGLRLCLASVAVKLMDRHARPMSCAGEHVILTLLCYLACEAGDGRARRFLVEDYHARLGVPDDWEALMRSDGRDDPRFDVTRWFEPYGPLAGPVHPLLTAAVDSLADIVRDDAEPARSLSVDDRSLRQAYLAARRDASRDPTGRCVLLVGEGRAEAIAASTRRLARSYGDVVRILSVADGRVTLEIARPAAAGRHRPWA